MTGEAEIFAEAIRSNFDRMLAVATRILRDREEAKDAVQDACIAAYEAFPRFEERSQLSTWLHRIVCNAALARLRQRDRLAESPIDDLLPQFDEFGMMVNAGASALGSVDELLVRAETRQTVQAAIDRLPPIYRTILVLRDIEELSMEEVANLLDVSTTVVKVRLHRGRLALKKLLATALRGDLP